MRKNNIEQNKSFFNKWSGSYDNPLLQFWMRGFQRPALREIKEIKTQKTANVLDISCGTGELLRKLVGLNLELTGVDLSPKMLAAARKKLPARVKLQPADVHQLPFQDNMFDYVLTTEAFHHYYNQQKAVQEMNRVVKLGGKVVVVDINFFLRPIHWLFERFEPGCVKVNNKTEMRQLFLKAGLQNIKQRRSFVFAVITVGEKQKQENPKTGPSHSQSR